ncbi:phage tail tube protein [Nocardiopsis ganjiahuensis]|uniref:phage tail tube protein n=1 Tax=Nocardiopsis ganjiahuensis TaxID=239984 RepID=UPI00034B479E|nr:hypothetical protein [Nocardiopsis ganjiahuensis]
MPASPIDVTDKFINAGVTTILFAPTIEDVQEPLRAELDAGTDLTREVIGSSGWTVSSANVTYNPLHTTFTPSIPGRTTVEDSSLTLPQDIGGADVREVLPRGTEGYIVIMHGGDEVGSPMDVWPVRVSSLGKSISTEGTEVANIVVSFAIPAEPAESVAIPDTV